MSLAALPLDRAVRLGVSLASEARARALPLGLAAVDAALPDAGLPRGAVVEIASPRGLARATSLALAACAAAQAEARFRSGDEATPGAWCAWIEPGATLFAPGVLAARVDLGRLLVVRPSIEALARVAVRVASSRAFSVVVVDAAGVPGCSASAGRSLDRWSTVVRRLALAVEGSDTTVILVTDKQAPRSLPLPTALRLELDRPSADRLTLRVAKDRRGRVAPPVSLAVGALSSVDLSFSTRKAPEEAPERAPRTPREGIG